jgi:ethanolamine utilization protein EutA
MGGETMHDWDYDHVHDDHEHDEVFDDGTAEDSILYQMENIELKSVGIDIGSSGTQVIFSVLKLRRASKDLSSRYVVVSRQSVYRSPILLTPYVNEERINENIIGKFIEHTYERAGIKPGEVHTGAVILTGEAIRRQNARAIGDMLSEYGGTFVCVTAGHKMEAMLAAFGSGAAYESFERKNRILNIDIGGGTTKLAVVENGRVIETAAIYIGGRLVVVDEQQKITRLDPGGKYIAEQVGFQLNVGDSLTAAQMEQITAWMAQAILIAVTKGPVTPEINQLFLTEPLSSVEGIDAVMFSGGVGEYVYGREERTFGDLGKLLGSALMEKGAKGEFPWSLIPAAECIRATVVGASEYSLQVSGNTHFISDSTLLPKRNLQVLRPKCDLHKHIDAKMVAQSIRDHFNRFDLVEGEAEVALSFHWHGEPAYERVSALAQGIKEGLANTVERRKPLYIILDGDIARTVGSMLREEFDIHSDIVSIDGILLQDFDFIDIGEKLQPSGTVPVTIKSLVFQL